MPLWPYYVGWTMRFVTNSKALTHHCTVYKRVGWHCYVFVYKAILRQLPFYLCICIIQQTNDNYRLSSHGVLLTVTDAVFVTKWEVGIYHLLLGEINFNGPLAITTHLSYLNLFYKILDLNHLIR